MKRFIALLSLCLSLVFQSFAQDSSLLWKITTPDGKTSSYLFGTYHLVGSDYLKSHDKVNKAYHRASNVVVEVVIDSTAMMEVAMKGLMLGNSLKTLIDSADYELLKNKLEPTLGMSLIQLDQFKPAAISALYAVMIAQRETPEELTFDGEPIDMFFASNGKKENKNVVALETATEQADILYNSATLEKQAEDLVELVTEEGKAEEMNRIVIQSYLDEDLDTMWEESNSMEGDEEEMAKMVDDRNIKWIPKLTPLLNKGKTFIAVGALHLPGENGLIKLLEKEGYTLSPVL